MPKAKTFKFHSYIAFKTIFISFQIRYRNSRKEKKNEEMTKLIAQNCTCGVVDKSHK